MALPFVWTKPYGCAVQIRLVRGPGPEQVARFLNSGYTSAGTFERTKPTIHAGRAFHQDIVPRRRNPPYAGSDRGAGEAARHALRLGGGGSVRAVGRAASGGRGGHSNR